jgi:DNA-binding LytR/AlgR family response regulator
MLPYSENSNSATIEVKISAREKKTILVSDIVYIKAFGKCSVIYMEGGCEFITYHMLKWFEESLQSSCFFRAHYSYIVSCKFIQAYCYKYVTLKTNEKIPLTRNKLADLKRHLENFLELKNNPDNANSTK